MPFDTDASVDLRPYPVELLIGAISLALRLPQEAGTPDAWRLDGSRLEVLDGCRVIAEQRLDPLGVGLMRRRGAVVCVIEAADGRRDYLTLGRVDMPAQVA